MRFEDFNFLELMMTSSNGNIIRVRGPVCGEFTGHRWIPLSKASNVEHWCYLRSRINGKIDHRPHSRQVTGARCTGIRGSPVMSWILLKANNAQQASGVGDKRFFRFKRNAQHCEQPLYDIMLMILHTNKWCVLISDQNLQIFFKSIWKIPSASGHSHSSWVIWSNCVTVESGGCFLNGFIIHEGWIKKIAWVPVVKVWANSVRGPNPKWPPAAIFKNRMGHSKITICPRKYWDTCFIYNLRLINPFLKPF